MARRQIICFGELVVDCFGSIKQGFVPKFGGAPGNTAVGLAKLGHRDVRFVGMVGNDFFGSFLRDTLGSHGVKTGNLLIKKTGRTTLAFVSLGKNGQRDFSFFSGAHDQIAPKDVRGINMQQAALLQFGSLTQSTEQAEAATKLMLEKAKRAGTCISYDPNVRLALWEKPPALKKIILQTLPKVNALKINEEEVKFLSGSTDPKQGAQKLWKRQMQLLVVTLGAKGAFWMTKTASGLVRAPKVKAIDTTGAGDAFNAGLWYTLAPWIVDGKLTATADEVAKAVQFATQVAALSTLKKGAIEGFPTLKQAQDFRS